MMIMIFSVCSFPFSLFVRVSLYYYLRRSKLFFISLLYKLSKKIKVNKKLVMMHDGQCFQINEQNIFLPSMLKRIINLITNLI